MASEIDSVSDQPMELRIEVACQALFNFLAKHDPEAAAKFLHKHRRGEVN